MQRRGHHGCITLEVDIAVKAAVQTCPSSRSSLFGRTARRCCFEEKLQDPGLLDVGCVDNAKNSHLLHLSPNAHPPLDLNTLSTMALQHLDGVELPAAADMHVHLRDGAMSEMVV